MVTFQIIAPRHVHDCDACRFVGYVGPSDVYSHNDTVILRHGNEGPDYSSSPREIAKRIPAYAPALALIDNFQPLGD